MKNALKIVACTNLIHFLNSPPAIRSLATNPRGPFVLAVLGLAVGSLLVAAQTAPLTTPQNTTLSVPAASIAAIGLPGSTNLTGSIFMLSAVMPSTARGGSASLVNSQQWVRRYNAGPGSYQNAGYAISLRGDGSAVVAGQSVASTTGYDFVTLAYAADGTPLWTNRYDGPAHGTDLAYYVATSGSGEVWVAGTSMRYATNYDLTDVAVVKYASNGLPLWTNRYNSFDTNGASPLALAVDAAGNAFVGLSSAYWSSNPLYGGTLMEDALIRYDPQGNTVWTKHFLYSAPYSGAGAHDVKAMALDGAGNLLVAGENGSGTSIVKYSGDGTALWTNSDSLLFMNGLTLLSVDRQGSAILTVELITNYPVIYVVMKRSADGASLWTNTLTGPLGYDGGDVPQTVLDPAGNVFLVGATAMAATPGSYQVLKMSSAGVPLWTNQNIVLGPTNCMIGTAAVDSAGNLYFTGHVPSPANGYSDIMVYKYSGNGQPLRTNRYDGTASLDDYPNGLAVDGAGNIYFTGQSESSLGSWDLPTVKYADLLLYKPPKDFTGTDNITYTLTDTLGNSATGSVQVLVAPNPFRFTLSPGATRLTPGGLLLQLDGAPGTNVVVIEASTNLTYWQPILTNAPANGTVQLLDSSAPGLPKRFYRAFQQQ
jgi:hypothetical protein